MGPIAHKQLVRVDTLFPQSSDLSQQNFGIHNHAIADDTGHARPADARGNQVQLKSPALVHHRVSGVVSASETHYAIGLARKVVNNFTLALVAPLSPDYGVSRHCALLPNSQ
jgi:hypothetical protein